MTEAGSIVGTAQYLSPEQARGAAVDQRSDLYSLGIVLYELLTGTVPFSGDTPVEIAMKHLSQVPEPPSTRRPDVPRELDQVVMRALAKNPDDRYQSAEEMDADLERVAGGGPVTPETVEFATQIMRAPAEPFAPTAATMITPARYASQIPPLPPPIYYDLEQPIHRRPIWPWIAALLFAAGAAVGGWYIYHQISNKLSNSAPVAVQLYLGMQEQAARDAIKADGFTAVVNHHANRTTPAGQVYKQQPTASNRVAKGSPVTIWVSGGKPKVAVPPLKGMPSADRGGGADEAAPETRRASGPGRRQGGGRRRAGSEGGHEARRGRLGAHQRREGADAGAGAERRQRHAQRRDRGAEPARVQGDPDAGRLLVAREHRARPEPERGDDGGEGLLDQPHRLEGAAVGCGARGDRPRLRLGDAAAAERRFPLVDRVPDGERPELRRGGARPDPGGRLAREAERPRNPHRRQVPVRRDDDQPRRRQARRRRRPP